MFRGIEESKYLDCILLINLVEFLLVLSMIFIASFLGLWTSDFDELDEILLLVCFSITFVPNIPGFKSYLLYKYAVLLNENKVLKYVLKKRDLTERLNLMYCVLFCIEQGVGTMGVAGIQSRVSESSSALTLPISGAPMIMQQYKFSNYDNEDKQQFIAKYSKVANAQNKRSAIKRVLWILYGLSSFIAILSPIGWMIWYSMSVTFIKMSNKEIMEFIFAWCIIGAYFCSIMAFMLIIKTWEMSSSWNIIWFRSMFRGMLAHNSFVNVSFVKLDPVKKNYQNLVTIKTVLDMIQTDIGIVILSFILES